MLKRYYDPSFFVQSLDSIDRDRFIIATYYIEDSPGTEFIDHFDQLQRLIAEGSTGTWMRTHEETPEVRELLAGRLVGYYEVPAEKGTKKAVIQIAYPTAAWDTHPNFPMMLLGPAGNCFIFSKAFRLLDVAFPPSISKRFPGPRFGIEGIRTALGVHDRPLLLHIIKPKMGMTPEQTADQCYLTAMAGVDIVKDDEMAGDACNCGFQERFLAVSKALAKAEKQTGRKTLYMVSVTDEFDRMREKARWAAAHGATGLLLTYSGGYSSLRMLSEDPQVNLPILLHVSHMVALLPSISFIALAKFGRLAGADMMLVPSTWLAYQVGSLEEGLRTVSALQQKLENIRPAWPIPGGGLHPGLVSHVVREYGPDLILAAGGGLLGHPQGPAAGVKAFRQSIDAVMAGVEVEEWAKEHPELRAALDTWGSFERPRTPWGYGSSDFRPKVSRR